MMILLLLLALFGHAALWVGMINRVHAVGLRRWIVKDLAALDYSTPAWKFAPSQRDLL